MATASKGVPVFKEYKPETDGETKKDEGNIAQRAPEPGNIYFYHPDHLGTSTYLTDANGQPYQFFSNLPFGEIVAQRRFIEHQTNNILVRYSMAAQPYRRL